MFLSKLLFPLGLLGVFASSLLALECAPNDNCKYFRIGVGGAYHGLSSKDSQNADISSIGGYLSFSARGVLKSRLASELGGKIGLGSAQSKGDTFSQDIYAKNTLSIFNDFYFKLGLNIATSNVPLFINVIYGWDNFSTNTKSKGIGLSRSFIGGELDGYLPTNKARIEYLVGYYYFLSGNYVFANTNTSSKIAGSNYMFKASLGYAADITPQVGYYIKLIGKYENMSQSRQVENFSYPSSTNIVGMLEVGIEL